MIIANRGGHNYQAQGAGGYVNEVVEDRKINSATIKHLRILGHGANDVTPGNCNSDVDLVYGVQMANNLDVDVFDSNHLNACYTTAEAMGCECVTFGDAPSVAIADRIRDNLVKLGFKYRQNKVNKELYELRAVVAPSVIVESFFCDSYADVQNYYRVGADEIGRAIAFGLVGKSFETIKVKEEEKVKVKYQGHIQNIGWQEVKFSDQVCGTTGQGLRLEALMITYPGILFRAHIENLGWTNYRASSEMIGTIGGSLRIESIEILSDKLAFSVHLEGIGWTDYKTNAVQGTVGESRRIEAIRIREV